MKRGRIFLTAIVNCGKCGAETTLKQDKMPGPTFARSFRRLKWRYQNALGWVCPDCLKRTDPDEKDYE
jgi:hypothetical protein